MTCSMMSSPGVRRWNAQIDMFSAFAAAQDIISSFLMQESRRLAGRLRQTPEQVAADLISESAARAVRTREHEEKRRASLCLQSHLVVVSLFLRSQSMHVKSSAKHSHGYMFSLSRFSATTLQAHVRSSYHRRTFSHFKDVM